MRYDWTVIGSRGFLGSQIADELEGRELPICRLDRWSSNAEDDLGNVIDCGGLTGDFRSRPDEIFPAHTFRIHDILKGARLSSYLYLSSTRVYGNAATTREEDPIVVRPHVFDDSYNISKLAGEAICFLDPRPSVRVVRLSNVVGSELRDSSHVTQILRQILDTGKVTIREALESSRDYIHISDAISYLVRIAEGGSQRLYNVAYGENKSNRDILDILRKKLTFTTELTDDRRNVFPEIDNHRLVQEFGSPDTPLEKTVDEILCRGGRYDATG